MPKPETATEAAFLADFKVLDPTGKGPMPKNTPRKDPKIKPDIVKNKGKKPKKGK